MLFGLLLISLYSTAQMSLENSNGRESNSESILKDHTAPRTDLLRTETGDFIYGPATRIKFKYIEEGSGIATTYFKVADHPFMQSDGRQMMPHELADGQYRMLYYSVDKKGNQEEVRADMIYIDKKGPEVSSYFGDTPVSFEDGLPVFSKNVHLTINVDDEWVNVQKVTYSINDSAKIESLELNTIDLTDDLLKIQDETIRIEITAYDFFYNLSKEVVEFKILRQD